MAHYDVYGLGNALVDTEYHVSDALLEALGVEKGMMTLIDDSQLIGLEEQLRNQAVLKKQASGGSAANSLIAAANSLRVSRVPGALSTSAATAVAIAVSA